MPVLAECGENFKTFHKSFEFNCFQRLQTWGIYWLHATRSLRSSSLGTEIIPEEYNDQASGSVSRSKWLKLPPTSPNYLPSAEHEMLLTIHNPQELHSSSTLPFLVAQKWRVGRILLLALIGFVEALRKMLPVLRTQHVRAQSRSGKKYLQLPRFYSLFPLFLDLSLSLSLFALSNSNSTHVYFFTVVKQNFWPVRFILKQMECTHTRTQGDYELNELHSFFFSAVHEFYCLLSVIWYNFVKHRIIF